MFCLSSFTIDTNKELEKLEEEFKYDASTLKTSLLGIDLFSTLLSSIFLATVESEKTLAWLSLALLCITTALVIVLASIYFITKVYSSVRSSDNKRVNKCLSVAAYTSVALGAVLYFVGDNIVQAAATFGILGCGDTCILLLKDCSKLLLFMALTFLRLVPFLVTKCSNAYKKSVVPEEKKEEEEVQPKGKSDQQLALSNPQLTGNLQSANNPPSLNGVQSVIIQEETSFQQTASFQQQSDTFEIITLPGQENSASSTGNGTTDVQKHNDKENHNSSSKKKKESWSGLQAADYVASNFGKVTLGLLVEVDAIYTGIWEDVKNTTNASEANECQSSNIAIRWSTLGIFGVAWVVFIVVYALYFNQKTIKCLMLYDEGKWCFKLGKCCSPKNCCFASIFVIILFIVMLYPVPYLLSDNTYPLECYQESNGKTIRTSLLAVVIALNIFVIVILSEILKKLEGRKTTIKQSFEQGVNIYKTLAKKKELV